MSIYCFTRRLFVVAILFSAQNAFSAPNAYRYLIGKKLGVSSACKADNETKKTYLKLYIPNGAGRAETDSVRVKVHVCVMGDFMASNFSLRLPLKKWSESPNDTHTFRIPASLMASEFGAKGGGLLTVRLVDQNALSGVSGFQVGTHYPLKSLSIQIPSYGVTLNATLQRIQAD